MIIWLTTGTININLNEHKNKCKVHKMRSTVCLGAKVVTHCNLGWPGTETLLLQVRPQHALGLLVRLGHSLHQKQHNKIWTLLINNNKDSQLSLVGKLLHFLD